MKRVSVFPSLLITAMFVCKVAAQSLYVGNNSSGVTETFSSGTNIYNNTYIGLNSGDSGNILSVKNSGTLFSNNQVIFTGYWGGSNQLVVSNGAKLTTGVLSVGQNSVGNSALFTGPTTLVSNAGELVIGNSGGAALNSVVISDGAEIRTADTKVGWEGSSNSMLATGINTVWNNIGAVAVGQFGAGNSVSVSDGASVCSSAINVGIYSLSNSASISGSGSSWQVGSNGIVVGVAGFGHKLSLSNGARLTNSGVVHVGWDGASNAIAVSGPDTVWSNAGYVLVGQFGAGNSVSVSDGAEVYSSSTTLSGTASASNSLLSVRGHGSKWITAGQLVVGSASGTSLQVLDSGEVAASNVLVGAGSTISGTGTIKAPVVISTGATLDPGSSVGQLSIQGDLTLAGGASYNWQVVDGAQPDGIGSDTVNVSGTLDLSQISGNSLFTVNLSTLSSLNPSVSGNAMGFNGNVSRRWTIITAQGGIKGFDADYFTINTAATNGSSGFSNSLPTGSSFRVGVDGNSLKLIYTVPSIDSDGDGLTDEAEILLQSLGFDPLVNNAAAVISLFVNPNNAFLFTQEQLDNSRSSGRSDVINNPMSYGLYTSNSIMDLRMGGLMIQRQGTNAVVSFQPQTTTDLSLPFTNNGTPISHTIPMPGNKGFIRINAKP